MDRAPAWLAHERFPEGTLEWAENATDAPARALVIYSAPSMAEFFNEVRDSEPSDLDSIAAAGRRHGLEVIQ